MPTIQDSKCVLVVGATAGIGRALALAIHDLPSKPTVIVSGRRQERLDELAKKSDRIHGAKIDIDADRETLVKTVDGVLQKYPEIDGVIFSAGIQREFKFKEPEQMNLDSLYSEFNTNYLSIVTMISKSFLPHFYKVGKQGHPCFVSPVTSGLAIVPGPWVPNYCATKAALHSLSLSLIKQLEGTNVQIMEIIPPLVESELHDYEGTTERLSKIWMPLDEFTNTVMDGLKRGDPQIAAGMSKKQYEKYEQDKLSAMISMPGK
ncbi:NAD-P-binding protein [Stereum hirsutum FP-91666 SS1]|uniref:NAD-P-binding protein n=1 Tax=Stereum hirsutum (strain FP-91666) TaxID=721885 RepID=UPI0004449F13|nr:NAD-P-binding protein [Stereum hirsutum FP-91666 SS1]EIM83357.1 NAD-P-binding protein [Stereum hirsutum FP-91666 SS1]